MYRERLTAGMRLSENGGFGGISVWIDGVIPKRKGVFFALGLEKIGSITRQKADERV